MKNNQEENQAELTTASIVEHLKAAELQLLKIFELNSKIKKKLIIRAF